MIRSSSHHLIPSSYFTRPLLTILLLGFSSGLPLALTAATLSFWLADEKVNLSTIGLFAIVATPYTLKFLWSPLMDNLNLPVLSQTFGRRRGWILATQIALTGALLLLATTHPGEHPFTTALCALLVSFLSASQDIVIDAYRVEILTREEQGRGAAMAQLGYRLGMLASGAGALYLAQLISWPAAYIFMAALLALGIATICFVAREPDVSKLESLRPRRDFKTWIRHSVIDPFADFMQRPHWWLILIFITAYALADAFIGRMANPFLHDLGFSKIDVANVVKIYGTVATLIGAFIGGALTARSGAIRVLFIAGILHACTNLLYAAQAQIGADLHFLALSVMVENITGGISAAAFVAYLSGLCNVQYTATQYALLSSLAAFGRTWLSTPAGYVAQYLGWHWFFVLSALLALPGLIVLYFLQKLLKATSLPAAGT